MEDENRQKHPFISLPERQRTFERIIHVIETSDNFLMLGHELPDEDCIASLVSMSLLIGKFGKKATIFLREQVPDQLSYLMNICTYNNIPVLMETAWAGEPPQAIFVLDTPKPEMIALSPDIKEFLSASKIPVIEIDHHLSADAAYSGDEGLRFVCRSTSTCQLIAWFCIRIACKIDLMVKYGITDLYTRNLVLSMLTGIIGDTRYGLTLKTNRDIFFYKFFTSRLSHILEKSSTKDSSNYTSMHDIFSMLQSLSVEERKLYQALLDHAHYSGRIGYLALDLEESRNYLNRVEYSLFVKVIKSVTDFLSEKSGKIGMTVYYDTPEVSNLIQFRIRVARDITDIDLRSILESFKIKDGGGHPGAIGFRVPAEEMTDFPAYIKNLLFSLKTF